MGLFATARSEVLESPALVSVIHDVLVDLGDHETMVALPSLRLAFSFFPPIERRRIAEQVARLLGGGEAEAFALVSRLSFRPEDVARGLALDHATTRHARRYGLDDAMDEEAS